MAVDKMNSKDGVVFDEYYKRVQELKHSYKRDSGNLSKLPPNTREKHQKSERGEGNTKMPS